MTRLLPAILLLSCLASPLQGQESSADADAAPAPAGAADEQQADDTTAGSEDEADSADDADEDAGDDSENSDLDEQTYDEDDDDFTPSEEIPADEAIPFPTNI